MLNFIFYKMGQLLALTLPLKFAYKLAEFLATLKCFFAPADRKAVINNLKIITQQNDERILKQQAYQVHRNFAKYLVDFFRFSKIDAEYIKKYIKIDNLNHIDNILKKGKGLIALSAHLGNWELGGLILPKLGYSLNAIVLNHKAKLVNQFFTKQRSLGGLKLIPLGVSSKNIFNCLKRNEILAIVGDRDFLKTGVKIEFFGKPTIIPKGPAFLSLKIGSPIIPGFMVREPDDTFRLIFENPINFTPTGNMDADLTLLIQACTRVLEKYIRRYPDQWYMFRKFWED